MTVFVYVNTSEQVGDPEHIKVFANGDAAEKWFEENDPEGVAFEYEVLEWTAAFQLQLAESEMAEKIDVEVTGKSQFEVAYEMARFILINMEGRQVKSIRRQEVLHLVADCIEALRGIKVREIVS
jgi:hypothetical protein